MIPMQGDLLIHAKGLHKSFKKVKAVDGVNFSLARGEYLALLGPNGAGKTTLLNALSGLTGNGRVSGSAEFAGRPLLKARATARRRLGIGRTFQHAEVFSTPDEPSLGWLAGSRWQRQLGAFGILIAFGHSILAMSGEESLAQVNREIASPKLKNLERTGLVIFIYSLLFTSLVSFFAVMIIPDAERSKQSRRDLAHRHGARLRRHGPDARRPRRRAPRRQ